MSTKYDNALKAAQSVDQFGNWLSHEVRDMATYILSLPPSNEARTRRGTMSVVYLLDGKPHRFCDCDPMVQTCAKGGTRSLQTCGFGRCLVPAPDVLVASEPR